MPQLFFFLEPNMTIRAFASVVRNITSHLGISPNEHTYPEDVKNKLTTDHHSKILDVFNSLDDSDKAAALVLVSHCQVLAKPTIELSRELDSIETINKKELIKLKIWLFKASAIMLFAIMLGSVAAATIFGVFDINTLGEWLNSIINVVATVLSA